MSNHTATSSPQSWAGGMKYAKTMMIPATEVMNRGTVRFMGEPAPYRSMWVMMYFKDSAKFDWGPIKAAPVAIVHPMIRPQATMILPTSWPRNDPSWSGSPDRYAEAA